MRILQPVLGAYRWWTTAMPRIRGRGLLLRVIDALQRVGVAAPIVIGEEAVRVEHGSDFVARSVMYRGAWEPEETALLRSLTPRGGVFLDVGANIGYFTLLASRWVGVEGRVYAMEPVKETFGRLTRNLALNGVTNVRAFQLGAARIPATAEIALASDAGHAHLVTGSDARGRVETVALTTIDDLVASEGFERLDVIKVDVEGADFEVLRGAGETLSRFRPVVLMEVELLARFGASVDDVKRFFHGLGYETQLLEHRSATDLLCRPAVAAGRVRALVGATHSRPSAAAACPE